MGNSASHPNGQAAHGAATGGSSLNAGGHRRPSQSQSPRRPSPATRTSTAGPGPTNSTGSTNNSNMNTAGGGSVGPGRPMKQKKKSLIELPDLNLGINPAPQRIPSHLPPAPIPIPSAAGSTPADQAGQGQAGQQAHGRVVSDAELGAGPSSLVVPPPPPLAPTSKTSSNASFGRKERKVPSRKHKGPYEDKIVRSHLFSGVPTNHDGIVNVLAPTQAPKVQVQILYPGQAESVSVCGTYEATWDIKTELDYEDSKRMWSTTVLVAPAAYHLKFLVDGVWKTSDALPLATDNNGRLVNYIDVRTKGPEIKEWGKDWWGVGTEDEEDQEQGAWTNIPPSYLETAAQLEEQEEKYRRNSVQSSQHGGGRPPRRILPVPPQLPRHLDKVILNTRPGGATTTREGRSGSVVGGDNPRGRTTHPSQGTWPSPMTGLSPGAEGDPSGRKRRDSGGSSGSGDRNGPNVRSDKRRGSSSADVGVYGGLIVNEGGGMSGLGAGIGSPIGDDNSVLPLPSHSVVNHLATSAIRNGVLAVATTTRYKAK
ncbi:hypothetical protein FRB91_000497, partial [Serendipita sp. 411]